SNFISRGTSKAHIFMYAAGCCLRTFSIAAAPCFLKSAASAIRKSLLNDLRVASKDPPVDWRRLRCGGRCPGPGAVRPRPMRPRPSVGRAAETEQRLEERNGAMRRDGTALTCRRDLLFARALLRRLDHAALGLDGRGGAAVDVVDIAADLQLAGIVDERILIG